jgi:L-threonylcarbamoyladenylate synthase
MPTETVYGLAADAENPAAVARVYAVKARPADHPLIVHLADGLGGLTGPHAWARDVPDYAMRLAERLWPGPLTLVLPRSDRAGDHITGGGDSVGLRCPAHPVAAGLLSAFAVASGRAFSGLAAPSANRFGRLSPTRAEDVLTDLGPLLDVERDCVLEGGTSMVGVESTIIDCTGPAPALLRPGGVGLAEIARVGGVDPAPTPRPGVRAPGTLAAHYAPRAQVLLALDADAAASLLSDPPAGHPGGGPAGRSVGEPGSPPTGFLAVADVPTPPGTVRLSEPVDAEAYARVLYAALREADALDLGRVVVIPPPPGERAALAGAVLDRVRRAAVGSRR